MIITVPTNSWASPLNLIRCLCSAVEWPSMISSGVLQLAAHHKWWFSNSSGGNACASNFYLTYCPQVAAGKKINCSTHEKSFLNVKLWSMLTIKRGLSWFQRSDVAPRVDPCMDLSPTGWGGHCFCAYAWAMKGHMQIFSMIHVSICQRLRPSHLTSPHPSKVYQRLQIIRDHHERSGICCFSDHKKHLFSLTDVFSF